LYCINKVLKKIDNTGTTANKATEVLKDSVQQHIIACSW